MAAKENALGAVEAAVPPTGMLYLLSCPNCLNAAKVDSGVAVAGWVCPVCANENVSSLPTDKRGGLIDNRRVVVDAKYAEAKQQPGFKVDKGTVDAVTPDELPSAMAASEAAETGVPG